MRRASFYSSSPRSRGVARPAAPPSNESPEKPVEPPVKRRWRDLYSAYERQLLFGALVLLLLLSLTSHFRAPEAQTVSQHTIDSAVQRTLAEQVLPSPAAKVFAAVHGAIVQVRTSADALEYDEYLQRASGSGVVIVNRGKILTSLHVVAGAGRIRVVFADGLESDAKIISQQPENDLAVLQADTVPDDLAAATMRPKADLKYGDVVVAVGFPLRHRALGHRRRGLRPEAQLPHRGRRPVEQPDPVRRGGEPGQLGRSAAQRRAARWSASSPRCSIPAAAASPASASPCRSKPRPRRPERRLSEMSFLSPEFLWLLLAVPMIAGFYLLLLKKKKQAALRYANLEIVKAAIGKGLWWRRHVPPAILLAALGAMLFATARPTAVITLPTHHETVILAIDVSGSMRANDVEPSRIEAAQAAARAFIADQPRSTRIGVVAFAGSAALVQPPTSNRHDLRAAIDQLQLQHATAVGSGILVSLKALVPAGRLRPADWPEIRAWRSQPFPSRRSPARTPRARSSCSPTARPPPAPTRSTPRASPPSAACACSPSASAPTTARSSTARAGRCACASTRSRSRRSPISRAPNTSTPAPRLT